MADYACCWCEEEAIADAAEETLSEYELVVFGADAGQHDGECVSDRGGYEEDLVNYGVSLFFFPKVVECKGQSLTLAPYLSNKPPAASPDANWKHSWMEPIQAMSEDVLSLS